MPIKLTWFGSEWSRVRLAGISGVVWGLGTVCFLAMVGTLSGQSRDSVIVVRVPLPLDSAMSVTTAAFEEADLNVAVRSELQGLVISEVFKLDFGGDGAYALVQADLQAAGLETDVTLSATLSMDEELQDRVPVTSSSTGYGALTWLMLQQLRTRLRTRVLD